MPPCRRPSASTRRPRHSRRQPPRRRRCRSAGRDRDHTNSLGLAKTARSASAAGTLISPRQARLANPVADRCRALRSTVWHGWCPQWELTTIHLGQLDR
jgi:hypothetical protein